MATSRLQNRKPRAFIAALKEAERMYAEVEKPSKPGQYVSLSLDEIETDTDVFQPREFSYGFREVDRPHVEKLSRAIGIHGELDPLVVVKLWRGKWYCVDGHHRLAAYRKQGWSKKLKCRWAFGAKLRDVLADALEGNNKVLLSLDNTTRQNVAWRYTLLGGFSKEQVKRAASVSLSQVALMRRVKAAYDRDQGPVGKRLRGAFRFGLDNADWLKALSTYNGLVDDKIVDVEERAQRLSRRLSSKMTNTLTKDLEVGARALMIYSPELVRHIRDVELSELATPRALTTALDASAGDLDDDTDL